MPSAESRLKLAACIAGSGAACFPGGREVPAGSGTLRPSFPSRTCPGQRGQETAHSCSDTHGDVSEPGLCLAAGEAQVAGGAAAPEDAARHRAPAAAAKRRGPGRSQTPGLELEAAVPVPAWRVLARAPGSRLSPANSIPVCREPWGVSLEPVRAPASRGKRPSQAPPAARQLCGSGLQLTGLWAHTSGQERVLSSGSVTSPTRKRGLRRCH